MVGAGFTLAPLGPSDQVSPRLNASHTSNNREAVGNTCLTGDESTTESEADPWRNAAQSDYFSRSVSTLTLRGSPVAIVR